VLNFHRKTRLTFAATSVPFVEVARKKYTPFAQIAEANWRGDRGGAKSVFDAIGEEAFLADDAHADQPTLHAVRQKLLT
jgi:hypothetical protein